MDSMSPKKTGQNACTSQYSPHSGGYAASEIETGAGPVADVSLSAPPTDPSGQGNYNTVVNGHGNWPHSPADPDVEGAPIGATPSDPTRSMY